ncbi:MAG TPA: hypothetical protein DEP51_00240 [Clostridiales bacterium]|nr:hypothetical protein [Clostridiales bacterium]
MAHVKITMLQVSSALGQTKPVYESTCKSLQNAYKKMSNLHSYWGGNLYNKIQKNWNEQVEELQNFLKITASAYNATSQMLFNYSSAENKPINRGEVSSITLGTIVSSDQDILTATSETIRADKLDIIANLYAAKNGIETVFKHLTTIEASSPNIDELIGQMRKTEVNITTNLESIRRDIETNMETAASNYDAAEHSI